MLVFDTPEPISVRIEVGAGDVRITAEDRTDTVVEVRPTDGTDDSDVQAAARTSVEYTDGVLVIRAPRSPAVNFSRKSRSVDVSLLLPLGSYVHGEAAVADLHCSGRLGECTFRTGFGHVSLEHIGPLRLRTSGGRVTVGRVDGDAEVSTGGRIKLGAVGGAAVVRNSNGTTELGRISGDVHVRSANGDVSVGHALGRRTDVETANGSIHVGEVTDGTVVLRTSQGDLEIGIGADRSARLDLTTGFGRVHNMLETADETSGKSIDVRAQTSLGDITVHRT